MEKFTKKDLAERLAEEFGITKKLALAIIEYSCQQIIEELANDKVIDFNHFGKLEVLHKEAREGINPITKEKILIAAKKSIKFRASKNLKDAVK